VPRKHDHGPDVRVHGEAALVGREKALAPGAGQIGQSLSAVPAFTGHRDGAGVEVGGINLHSQWHLGLGVLCFAQQHGQAEGLFTGGATQHPGPHRPAALCGHQSRQDLCGQVVPDLRVPEECGHANQHFRKQHIQLLRVALQVQHVVGHAGQLVYVHAPLDPAQQGAGFVERKIVLQVLVQQVDDGLQNLGERPR